MKQQWREEFDKSKQIKLITKCLSSTHSAEQEAPPPIFLFLGEASEHMWNRHQLYDFVHCWDELSSYSGMPMR